MIYLIVFSGLCNRLFAIISAMRYAKYSNNGKNGSVANASHSVANASHSVANASHSVANASHSVANASQKLKIYWKIPVARYGIAYNNITTRHTDENLHYFFQDIPNVILESWTENLVPTLTYNNNDITMLWDGSLIVPEYMERDKKGNLICPPNFLELINQPLKFELKQDVIINMITSPFGIQSDKDEEIHRHYPTETNKPRTKTQYEKELSLYAKKLKPIKDIQTTINFYEQQFEQMNINHLPRMGIHIRRTDLATTVTQEQLDTIIDTYIQKNQQQYVIYLCSDDINIQKRYADKYQILTYTDVTKTYNNLEGAQKAVVDLYMLGSCNYILGTKSSSFSYYSFILSKDDTIFEIHS
jgi:hypothetical protein